MHTVHLFSLSYVPNAIGGALLKVNSTGLVPARLELVQHACYMGSCYMGFYSMREVRASWGHITGPLGQSMG